MACSWLLEVAPSLPPQTRYLRESVTRFQAGLQQCGLSADAHHVRFRRGVSRITDAWQHPVHAPGNILWQGFDPTKRKGQGHGRGEYFTTSWATAQNYTRGTGAVVVCLIIRSKARFANTHVIVVDNPLDRSATYCLPFLLLGHSPNVVPQLPPCRRCVV